MKDRKPWVDQIVTFFNSIGISTHYQEDAGGFFPGVSVVNGTLEVSPSCCVSDLLHEGGHLAVVPAQYRHLLHGDVGKGLNQMLDDLAVQNCHPDELLYRAVIQASDPEVQAWAWACGEHLNIPEEIRILDSDFGGGGQVMRSMLALRSYVGINGLAHAGFCLVRPQKGRDFPAYPKLAFWAHPVIQPGTF